MPTGVYKRSKAKMSDEVRKAKACAKQKHLYATSARHRDLQKSNKLQKAYGITLEQYTEFSKFCGDVCVICEKPCPSKRKLAVDHDHTNGVIRGLLCINCNKGLGNFKDNIELLQDAINYLKAYQEALGEHSAVNTR